MDTHVRKITTYRLTAYTCNFNTQSRGFLFTGCMQHVLLKPTRAKHLNLEQHKSGQAESTCCEKAPSLQSYQHGGVPVFVPS